MFYQPYPDSCILTRLVTGLVIYTGIAFPIIIVCHFTVYWLCQNIVLILCVMIRQAKTDKGITNNQLCTTCIGQMVKFSLRWSNSTKWHDVEQRFM